MFIYVYIVLFYFTSVCVEIVMQFLEIAKQVTKSQHNAEERPIRACPMKIGTVGNCTASVFWGQSFAMYLASTLQPILGQPGVAIDNLSRLGNFRMKITSACHAHSQRKYPAAQKDMQSLIATSARSTYPAITIF